MQKCTIKPFIHSISLSVALFFLYSSGLSYEESKELTKADPNQESARPQSPSHQTGPVAQTPAETKCTKDSNQADAAAKEMKLTQTLLKEPLKTLSSLKESVPAAVPMKTRRSQYAEDRKLNAAQSGPAMRTSEVEGQTESEKKHKEDLKEENTEPPQLHVRKSPPPKAKSEVKEDQPASVVKPAMDNKTCEPSGPSETQKRKSLSEAEGELTPEKRPRMSSVSSVSSVSSASPSVSSISSPSTPTPATNQRVPPLKVGKHL